MSMYLFTLYGALGGVYVHKYGILDSLGQLRTYVHVI